MNYRGLPVEVRGTALSLDESFFPRRFSFKVVERTTAESLAALAGIFRYVIEISVLDIGYFLCEMQHVSNRGGERKGNKIIIGWTF